MASWKVHQTVKPLLWNQRLDRHRLKLELVAQVVAVQVEVVDRGQSPETVESHPEAWIRAQEHRLNAGPDGELGQDLRQTEGRIWDKEAMSKLQRADVDQDNHSAGLHLLVFSLNVLCHLHYYFFWVYFIKIKLLGVEPLLDAQYLLRLSSLCTSFDIQLSHVSMRARQDARS